MLDCLAVVAERVSDSLATLREPGRPRVPTRLELDALGLAATDKERVEMGVEIVALHAGSLAPPRAEMRAPAAAVTGLRASSARGLPSARCVVRAHTSERLRVAAERRMQRQQQLGTRGLPRQAPKPSGAPVSPFDAGCTGCRASQTNRRQRIARRMWKCSSSRGPCLPDCWRVRPRARRRAQHPSTEGGNVWPRST